MGKYGCVALRKLFCKVMKGGIMRNSILISIFFITSCGLGKNIGFGIGQTLGEHLLIPSLFTMRIQLSESFVVAPEIDFQYSSSEEAVDSIESSTYVVGLESNFHYSLVRRERTVFYGIGGIGFEISKDVSEWYEHQWYPDTLTIKVKHTTSKSSQGVNLGLGLEQFLTDNLSFLICSLSNLRRTTEKTDEKRNGETETLRDVSGFSLDFQNLKYCVYLIWYL